MTFNNIICPTCGTQLPTDSSVCGNCGNQLINKQVAFGSQGYSSQQPNQPINCTSYYPPTSTEQPSYIPTVLVTILLSIFGLIPAIRHSQMAKARGYSQNGYWWTFGGDTRSSDSSYYTLCCHIAIRTCNKRCKYYSTTI